MRSSGVERHPVPDVPNEADKFASDGCGDNDRPLPACAEPAMGLVQAELCFP